MKKRLNQIVRWVSTKGLVWLGFGATPFIFMACYGPVPTNYNEVGLTEEVVDSTDVIRSGDVAEEDVAGDSLSTEDQV
ncbi:MAG: hypothetical protein IKO86_06780 [Prevotella sp.]|nr:hypothetical protein [Prevotella sp.]